MAMTTSQPGFAVLSFDGGGVRGYSSLLIVEALMDAIKKKMKLETVPRPCDYFNVIGGTSSGGLNAILLGRLGMSAGEALEAYRRVAKLAFTPVPHLPYSPKGAYSGENLKKAVQNELERHVIGDKKAAVEEEIQASGDQASAEATVEEKARSARERLYYDPTCCKTVVFAKTKADVTARPTLFKTYDTDPRWASCKIWEIARATSAATTFFPSIPIGRDQIDFLDTALGNNNNCNILFDEISQEFPKNNIFCIVSIGTGLQNAVELQDSRPSIMTSLAKLATNSNNVHHAMMQRHGGKEPRIYWRFDENAGLHEVELDSWGEMSKVAGHTSNYINEPQTRKEINDFADCIIAAKGEGSNAKADNPQFEVPFPPNPTFLLCQSNNIFERLDGFYREHVGSVPTTALYGMSGVGKTQIALSYAYRCRDKQSVFWLNADDQMTIQNNVETMTENLKTGNSWESDTKDFKRYLETLPHRWLLILDNVDDYDVIRDLLPTKGCGGILFTTQTVELLNSEVIDDEGHKVKLMAEYDAVLLFLMQLLASKHFPKDTLDHVLQNMKDDNIDDDTEIRYHEARDLIQTVYGIHSYKILLTLARKLQQLPLGLVHSAAYMSLPGSEMKISDYIGRLKSQKKRQGFWTELLTVRGRRATHRRNLHSAWSMSVQKVNNSEPDAVPLLKLFGFLGRPISEKLIENALNSRSYWNGELRLELPPTTRKSLDWLDFGPSGHHDLESCLRSLASLHLIERDVTKRTIQLHSLMQEWIHLQLPSEARAEYLHEALTVVAHQLPPIMYSGKDMDIPYLSRLSLVHADKLAEMSLQDVGSIKDPYQSILFFLDAYLWDFESNLLTAANDLLPADITPRFRWASFLASEAKLYHMFSVYQAHKHQEFDSEAFNGLCSRVDQSSLSMQTPPATSKEWISWAVISTRIIEEIWLDEGTNVPDEDPKLQSLIKRGRDICVQNIEVQLEKNPEEKTVEAVCKASVVQYYARMNKQLEFLDLWDLLDQYWNHAIYGLTCGLELANYFRPYIEKHWQVLSRKKHDYVDEFIQALDACGAHVQLYELMWDYACALLRNYPELESVTSFWIGVAACLASYIRSHNIDPTRFISYTIWPMGTPTHTVAQLHKYFSEIIQNADKMGGISLKIIGSTLNPTGAVLTLFQNCYNDIKHSNNTDDEIANAWQFKLSTVRTKPSPSASDFLRYKYPPSVPS